MANPSGLTGLADPIDRREGETIMTRRTIGEINQKIKSGRVVVLTAGEMVGLVRREGVKSAARQVDVVTTGTFAPLSSAGLFASYPQPRPRVNARRVELNGVAGYCGLAAAEFFLGAAEPLADDPLNRNFPGEFRYGGGHVIEDLIAGREVELKVEGYGQSCHPGASLHRMITLADLPTASLFCPAAGMSAAVCGVNASDSTLYSVLGALKPRMGAAAFCSAGELSPLLKDPDQRTMGPGSRLFLGGGVGMVVGPGLRWQPWPPDPPVAQPDQARLSLMLVGRLDQMSADWAMGNGFQGYGSALALGIGCPIPILDEDMAAAAGRSNENIKLKVVDLASDFPTGSRRSLGEVSMAELMSGSFELNGRRIAAAPLSSVIRAQKICSILKDWIGRQGFLIGRPEMESE